MNIFIAGATGVLGKRVTKSLVRAGVRVTGLSRSGKSDELLRSYGAIPCRGDLFNPDSILAATAGMDMIVHLATAIPQKSRPTSRDWAMNDRIRTEGTDNLLRAAIANGCRDYLQQSVLYLYGDRRGEWVDELTPVSDQLPGPIRSARSMEILAKRSAEQHGLRVLTLRFGMFYAADAGSTRSMLSATGAGKFPLVGGGVNFWNLIHVDDAAEAVLRGVQRAGEWKTSVLNVCDDEPAMYKVVVGHLASALEAPEPRSIPRFLAKLAIGPEAVKIFTASVRSKNSAAREQLDWKPQFRSYREGFTEVIDRWKEHQ